MSEIKKLLKEKTRSISQGQFKEAAEACNAIGNELLNQERYEEALKEHSEELELFEMIGDNMGIAVANRRIGECYTLLNDFKKALYHIRKFYDLSVSLKSVVEEQRAWATFGRTYYLKYQHEIVCDIENSHSKTLDQAELAYYKALKLLYSLSSEIKPIELAEMKCRLLLNLGLVNENRGNYEESSKHLKQGLEIASEHHLYEDIQRCGLSLGMLYQKRGNLNEADKAYDLALSAAKKLYNKNMMCEIQLSKGINLIAYEKFEDAKRSLKSAYKLQTTNIEDHEKVVKTLKVSVGLCNCDQKLRFSKSHKEKKVLLEKIADGLSSINCYKLAIKKYLLTLEYMDESHATLSEKAPIYFSLAETYLDDGNILKALEYFDKELNCHEGKPFEQIKTLWKVADVFENEKNVDKAEEAYLKAISIAEKDGNKKIVHNSLSKLLVFYKSIKKVEKQHVIKNKLESIKFDYTSDDESDSEEEIQDPFNDVDLSDLSDSDNNNEETLSTRKRTKRIETKVNDKGETPLHQACISGNLNMVERLIENGHSVNVRDYCGWTPLHEACNYGFYDIVEYLLDKGANINDPGGPQCGGITALHDAASCGNLDVMRLLIARGASVTVVDKNGETPLHALLQYKERSYGELDEVTLCQCRVIENELKSKMKEAGVNIEIDSFPDSTCVSDKLDASCHSVRIGEKRARSPSLSSDIDSEDSNPAPPYLNINDNHDWNDPNNAKTEYRSVMESLRRSAASISPVKSQVPRVVNGPSLVNENEVVNEWLIKDTNEIPKSKRKKRRLAKLNVRTSKRIDNYLVPKDSVEKNETNGHISMNDDDSNFSISSITSDKIMETNFAQGLKISSKVSFCLRVRISDKLILVPVPDDTCTISWLSEEAAQRFKNLDGSKPHLTLTKNGAILSGSDLVKDIFLNNEEVSSSVDIWDEPSLEERYVQQCTKRNIVVSTSVKECFQCCNTSLNLSNCFVPPLHLSIIFLTLPNFKSLQYLNISKIEISDGSINELITCIPHLSVLKTLSMSCCYLTTERLKKITDFLNDNASQNFFPALKSLDLSFNSFSLSSSFISLLKLNSLVSLNISSCGLNRSIFLNQHFCRCLESKHNLEVFDVSGNILGESGISSLLQHLPKTSLKELNLSHTLESEIELGTKLFTFLNDLLPLLQELILQGCYLTDADIDQIALCFSYCPLLQKCDLSANPLLSSASLCNFVNKAFESQLAITDLYVTGTCVWKDQDFSNLVDLFKCKTLTHIRIDNCSEYMIEKLYQSWTNKWGNRALYDNFGFCEFNVLKYF